LWAKKGIAVWGFGVWAVWGVCWCLLWVGRIVGGVVIVGLEGCWGVWVVEVGVGGCLVFLSC